MVNIEKKIKQHQRVLTDYVELLAKERNESLG